MLKLLNELVPLCPEPPKFFNIKDIIIGDDERLWIDRKELLKSNEEFCELWDSKGYMKAMIEAEMPVRSGPSVLIRWEDDSRDWIPNNCLKYFDKV